MTDDLDAIRARHDVAHSCYGIDPIMGPGYRLFGGRDGVRCDAAILADMLSVERVAPELHDLGYGCLYPVRAEWGEPQHDDALHRQDAAAIIERLRGDDPA